MAAIKFADKMRLEKLFAMQGGYVLDFSNATFRSFVFDSVDKNIYDDKYLQESGSKAQRLRSFWSQEHDSLVGKLIADLIDYCLLVNSHDTDDTLLKQCRDIVTRLTAVPTGIAFRDQGQVIVAPDSPRRASTQNPLTVFLCHASQDKSTVRRLAERLRECGFDPWLDEDRLLPGQRWDLEINRALRSSHVILVCLSRQSISKVGYVQKEVTRALDFLEHQPEGSIFLIPLQLEECEIPDRLADLHVARLFRDEGFTQLVAALTTRAHELGLAANH